MENNSVSKKRQLLSSLSAAVSACLIYLLICRLVGIGPGQPRSFLVGDSRDQLMEFGSSFVHRLFGGKSLLYSFTFGLGMPMAAEYAFYALSPFNLFYLFIDDIEIATMAVITGKFAFTAFVTSLMLQKCLKAAPVRAAVFSLCYAFCGFFINFYMIYDFMDMLYFLPLLIMCMHFFLHKKNWLPLCLCYAALFAMQFYCGYIAGLVSFLMFIACLCQYCSTQKCSWKPYAARYALAVFCAALMAAPVILPAAAELFRYRTSDTKQFTLQMLSPWEFLSGFYPGQTQGTFNTIPQMYTGTAVFMLVSVFFASKKIERKQKIFAAIPLLFLFASCFIDPLYRFMHAFDAPNGYDYRFSFGISLWFLLIAVWTLPRLKELNPSAKFIWICAGSYSALYFLICFLQKQFMHQVTVSAHPSEGLPFICFIVILAFLLSGGLEKKSYRVIFLCLICVELFLHSYNIVNKLKNGSFSREYEELWQEHAENSLASIRNDAGSPFYRIHYLNGPVSSVSLLYDYNGLGWFSSIENGNIRHFLSSCGYTAIPFSVFDYGSTPLMRMLLSQEYSVECGFYMAKNRKECIVRKNEYTLPLAFMVDAATAYHTPEISNPFEEQNRLISNMTGCNIEVYHMHTDAMYLHEEGTEHVFLDEGTKVKLINPAGGVATYSFPPQEDGTAYAYMSRWGISESYSAGVPKIFTSLDIGGMERFSDISMPHIMPLGVNDNGELELHIGFEEGDAPVFDYEALYVAYEDKEALKTAYELLSPGGMKIDHFEDTLITGSVCADEQHPLLFTTIPYDPGWKAFVDGRPAEIQPVLGNAFCSITLAPGEHAVRFEYHNNLLLYGIMIGCAGLLLAMITLILCKRSDQKLKTHQPDTPDMCDADQDSQ